MSVASLPRRGLALVLALCAGAAVLAAPRAGAQTEEELAGARRLFARAVEDQNAKRYDVALDEFRRVAAVKETANVRYRIASCLESLGRNAEAFESYRQAVQLGQDDKQAADTVRAASDRVTALDRVVPRLSIVLPADAPPGTQVRLDDAPVDAAKLSEPLAVDVGHHTIAVEAPGRQPYRTGLTVAEGARLTITAELPAVAVAPASASASSSSALVHEDAGVAPLRSRTPGYVLIGVGGVLAAGSVVSLVLQAGNLRTLNDDCHSAGGGPLQCPQSKQSEANSAHDAAKVEGPLAIGLGIGAAVAAGIGLWWVLTSPTESAPASGATAVVPWISGTAGGVVVKLPVDAL